jgi:hypothetical protein
MAIYKLNRTKFHPEDSNGRKGGSRNAMIFIDGELFYGK